MTTAKKTIKILVQDVEENSKAALPTIGRKVISKTFEITNEALAEQLEEFFKSFQVVLERLPHSQTGFSVDEIQLSLAINVSGGIELIGKGEAGVSTGLIFTLKRDH